MAMTGTVKFFNPNKGWGFIECAAAGTDVFLYKGDLKGMCVEPGQTVQFNTIQNEKGTQAQDVTVVVAPHEASYFGEIKSFNPMKGYGFISSPAFPEQDVFLLKTDLPGQHGPSGTPVKFKVVLEAKGYAAKEVMLLGEAGKQVQMMNQMMGAWGMGPMMNMMGGMGKSMGKMGKGSPMGQMGQMGGKGMSKGNMVWQPQFMKKGMGPMGGPMALMGKGMM